MQPEMQKKLSVGEKVGFACGDLASNLYFQTFMTFMPYFYTNIFGLAAGAMGWMFLFSKLFDAVNDPIMGMLADRANTRWGKYRPFILFGAIPFGIAGILTFTTPGSHKLLYAFLTYNAVMMLYTLVNVPYCSLMGVMTSNTADRTVLSSYRFVGVFIGQFVAFYCVGKLPTILGGGGNEPTAKGYQITMTILSVAAIILLYITFFTSKERIHPPKGQKSPMGQDLKDLISNKPWLMIGSATLFQLIFVAIYSGARPYYFEFFVGNSNASLFGISPEGGWSHQDLLTIFLISGTVLTIIGVIATKAITRIFGKAFTYWGFLAITGVTTVAYFYLEPEQLNLIFGINLIRSFALGPVSAMQWAMFTDCADFNEWKTGRRATALMMAASLFFLKFGLAIGAAAIGWILGYYGYEKGVEITPEITKGIRLMNSYYPAVFTLLGVVVMLAYPLSSKKMLEIETDLLARRKAAGDKGEASQHEAG